MSVGLEPEIPRLRPDLEPPEVEVDAAGSVRAEFDGIVVQSSWVSVLAK